MLTEVGWIDVRTVEVTDAGGKDNSTSSENDANQYLQKR